MTHPYQEMKDMKRLKQHYHRLGFVADAQYGIPTRCSFGDEIKQDVVLKAKYPSDVDILPGRRYFTCKSYKDDGPHFRQPWAFDVEEKVEKLRREVNDMAEEIAKLNRLVSEHISGE